MATREQVLGNWNQLKGKVKEHWGQLTDRELDEVKGNVDQLVGLVQRKTGEARGQIEKFVDQLSDDAGGNVAQASEMAREYANQAADAMYGACDQVREYAREGYEICAIDGSPSPGGIRRGRVWDGLLLGVVVGLACRSR